MKKYSFVIFIFVLVFSISLHLLTGMSEALGRMDLPKLTSFDVAVTRDSWTLHDAIKNTERFAPAAHDGSIRFWDTRQAIWLRISVPYLREQLVDLDLSVLALQSEYLSDVEFYLPIGKGRFKKFSHGLDITLGQRSFPSRVPSVRLRDVDPNGLIFVRLKTSLPSGLNVLVGNEDVFFSNTVGNVNQYMFFYSFLISLTLTYLFFYLMTGHRGYTYSLLRQLGICMFIFSLNGFLQLSFHLPLRFFHAVGWLGFTLYAAASYLFWGYMAPSFTRTVFFRFLRGLLFSVVAMMLFSALIDARLFAILFSVAVVGIELLATFAILSMKYKEAPKKTLLFAASRLSFVLGIVFYYVDMFFPPRLFYQTFFFVGLTLDPVFLACMLIPNTRKRLENYFTLERESAHYEMLSQKDSMTGLYNKANLLRILKNSIDLSYEQRTIFSFIMIDIDHFKRYNDTWGHPEGDKALLFLSKTIQNNLREKDAAARYGGEEFSIILPDVPLSLAMLIADRIRVTCEMESHSLGEGKSFTISMGISCYSDADTVETLVKRADKSLYFAKANGRNRIETEESVKESSQETQA